MDITVDRDQWLHGWCFPFAETLSVMTGWRPVILWSHEHDNHGREISVTMHAAVRHPDGGFVDAGGRVTEEQMIERYDCNIHEICDTTFPEMHASSYYEEEEMLKAQGTIRQLALEDTFFENLLSSLKIHEEKK